MGGWARAPRELRVSKVELVRFVEENSFVRV